ncbi:SDR family NAD(P)-dependent oxidoreductase [Planktothrix agardhii]|jgi:3-oxoacyl-[acyl-carrier protein] reductase|uniref:Oxidoreductase YoxD n=2 Tax=Planktothrix agardhii TaxID=1160 RepID=A0A1J1JCP0_PLAAG|nr:SDR family NAD(P)-dependent oxidoreductase [Planktothrix agardhii]BBD56218.1 3-oxoacyl-[acyl-carrier-protein] reductase [Planktothrix agardhii NIES-204]MBG0746483.1 SDR family NAD(P)-dependent oxidoreductase [Planktothrix agardhii KL2]MCB8759217.1 SDR family NAD(P)-dependent oxidoreductase [Planktothrix agardhii 1813]MCB8787123.1 SDR family NAD(P)-dependent oxidoreductase [Planktothrix agardhii 1025]MCF3574950.1 SDR family NAD(P)-dependent oxidoreductase [Planktothrix agardhii 1812]
MKIQGKTALITGASRGIGRAIAVEFAKNGVKRLILVARDRQKLAELATEIKPMGVEVITLALDLTQSVQVHIAIAQAWRSHGPIEILVNCAGVAHQKPFLESKLPDVQEEISLNLIGLYTITHVIARRMATRKSGTIINVSSLMGKIAAPTMSTYSATKFAILGFTEALRQELAAHNIRVMALLPTLTDTDMTRNLQLFRWVVPMTPEQVAKVLVAGLDKDTSEILVGWQSHLAVWCNRFAPWLMEKIMVLATPVTHKIRKSYPVFNKADATLH